jgi:tRNA threonylcarbamoyladenosine biosynthesis protein TsaE
LRGDLGSGKTTFVRGLLRALGVDSPVQSPTYTLGSCYLTRSGLRVDHLDAYFGEKERAYLTEGGLEAFGAEGACIVEWPEKIEDLLPADRLSFWFAYGDAEDDRRVGWEGLGPRGRELAQALTSWATAAGLTTAGLTEAAVLTQGREPAEAARA